MDLQLFLEVDGSTVEQAEYVQGFALDKDLNARFDLNITTNIITIWADEFPDRGHSHEAPDPDPEKYASVIQDIARAGTFQGLKAKLLTTDSFMEARCRGVIQDLGIGRWATAAKVPELPRINVRAQPQPAETVRGTVAG